jgi:hypothetical protein
MSSVNTELTEALAARDLKRAFQAIQSGATNLNDELLTNCSKENCDPIVSFLVNNGAKNYSEAMRVAAANKNLSYALIFHDHGFNDFNDAIQEFTLVTNSSVQGVQLVFADSSQLDKREYLMASAAKLGDMESVQHYKDLGCTNYNLAYAYAAETDQLAVCQSLVSWGANNHNWALQSASRAGAHNVVDFAYHHGANNSNHALSLACKNGFLNKVKTFVEKGATNLIVLLEAAAKQGNSALVKYVLPMMHSPEVKAEIQKLMEELKTQTLPHIVELLEQHVLPAVVKTVEHELLN